MVDTTAEIVVFDGFDELDAIGPYEVLENAAQAGASLETRLVTLEETDFVTASHGLRVEPQGTLGEPDLLIVPGGGCMLGEAGDEVQELAEHLKAPVIPTFQAKGIIPEDHELFVGYAG